MQKTNLKKVLSWLLTMMMLLGGMTTACAEGSNADLEPMLPIMDLVCAAAKQTSQSNGSIVDEAGALTQPFVSAFFTIGQKYENVGMTADMLQNPDQQAAYLGKIFAANVPALSVINADNQIDGYIGFQPLSLNTGKDSGQVQVIGEMYWAADRIENLNEEQRKSVEWDESAVFTFQTDLNALNGMRLTSFSIGSEINMDEASQDYFDAVMVEYENSNLGFSIMYPSVFTDDTIVEESNGISAKMPDSSATFFAHRDVNKDVVNLQSYVASVQTQGSEVTFQDDIDTATESYTTSDGISVYNVYIVTDGYIYQAQLTYRQDLARTYGVYTSYLVNSFIAYEIAVG